MRTIRFRLLHVIILQVLLLLNSNLCACTIFCLGEEPNVVVGRNYDFDIGFGVITVNKRNLSKTAFIDPNEKAATWTSRYGSITFNQFAHEFPCGGMNEAGLVVEMALMYQEGKYPEPDERTAVTELQWIQYQLDNCASVKEVIESDEHIRIGSALTYLNYLACDRTGDVAVIEFLGGKRVAYTKKTLKIALIQNGLYQESVNSLSQYRGFGGNRLVPTSLIYDTSALFALAANSMKTQSKKVELPLIRRAFSVLSDATIPSHTQWSIVYDVNDLRIHYKTMQNPDVRTLCIETFDFDCNTPAKVLDVNARITGDTKIAFQDYSYELNKKMTDRFLNAIKQVGKYTIDISAEDREKLARYPESFKCINQ